MLLILRELANNVGDPNYWPTLVTGLMKRIPQVPTENPHRDDKLADSVARRNPKAYDEKYDLVKLEDSIKGMEFFFTVVEILGEKKVDIRMFYLSGELDIWWNTVKGRLLGSEFT